MLSKLVRIIIVLCLAAAPVVAIACTPVTTTVEEDTQVIETSREMIPTGD